MTGKLNEVTMSLNRYFILVLIVIGTGCGTAGGALAGVSPNSARESGNAQERVRVAYDVGQQLLENLRATFLDKTAEELIGMLFADQECTTISPGYFLKRDGNEAIKKELKARGESARSALVMHRGDHKFLFRSMNGPWETVGTVCRELLSELDKNRQASTQPGRAQWGSGLPNCRGRRKGNDG